MSWRFATMDVNYGGSAPFTLGVEEELQLVNVESFDLTSRYAEVFGEAARHDERIKPELLQSTVEVATEPAGTVGEAIAEAAELRRRAHEEAERRGVRVLSAGTHPFSRYEHQDVTDKPRYAELVDALQWAVERQLIFGLHVHVGLESANQAVAVANALRTWLPELLALSANSPFWHGRDTGLGSTRSKVFDAMPRSGLPPAFASFGSSSCWSSAASRPARSTTTRSSGGTCARTRSSGRSSCASATGRRASRTSPGWSR